MCVFKKTILHTINVIIYSATLNYIQFYGIMGFTFNIYIYLILYAWGCTFSRKRLLKPLRPLLFF